MMIAQEWPSPGRVGGDRSLGPGLGILVPLPLWGQPAQQPRDLTKPRPLRQQRDHAVVVLPSLVKSARAGFIELALARGVAPTARGRALRGELPAMAVAGGLPASGAQFGDEKLVHAQPPFSLPRVASRTEKSGQKATT